MRSLYPVISSNKSLGEGLTYVILAHPRLRLPSFDGRTRNAGQRRKNERSARICPTRVNNTNVKRGARVFCCTTVHMDLEVHAKLYRASHVLEDLGWVRFGEFPRLVGRYGSYLLPKQDGGTSQIHVN